MVPPDFHAIISQIYLDIGQPPVTRDTCWNFYHEILDVFRALDTAHNILHDIDAKWGYALAVDKHAGDIELTPNL